jgi:hypothetical protein
LKLFQQLGAGGLKRTGEVENSGMMYLVHCNNLCKCYNLSTPSTIRIKKNPENESDLDISIW